MKYTINEKVITNEYGSLLVFGVTGPTTKVEDVSEDKNAVEQVIELINKINLPEEELESFLDDFVEEMATVM